jgi:O-antigen/teichoic acid export membrane protein
MTTAQGNSHLLRNSLWNASAFLFNVGLNLLILPFILHQLGAAVFGVAGLVTACIAPAVTFSNALGLSITRELAHRLAPSQRGEARSFFATALLLAGAGGVAIALPLALLGPPIARRVFALDTQLAADLALAFWFGAGGWLCQCISAVFVAVFAARQNYARVASTSIATVVISISSMLAFVPASPLASTFLGCQALGFAAGLVLSFVLSRQIAGAWLALPALHRKSFAGLMSMGAWQFAAQGGALIASQADRYLLGAFLAPQFVGFYTVAQRLEEAMYIGVLKIGEILFPFFSTVQKESSERRADLLLRSSWILNVLAASALGGLIPVAGPLLHLWTGAEVANEAQRVLVLLAIAGMLGCTTNAFAFYLLAIGRTQSNALISFVTAAATLATSAVALPLYGWPAAGWSACIGMIAQSLTTTLLLRRSFPHRGMWSQLAHFVWMPLVTGIVTALVLDYFIGAALFERYPHWWYVMGLYGLGAGIIFAVVLAISGLGPYRAACWRDVSAIATRLFSSARFLA